MSFFEFFIVAIGLSMDAFAVAVCKGLSLRKATFKNMLTVGLYFGIFQAVMPLIGYILGSGFADAIEPYDHWIAFLLLGIIGVKMIKESYAKENSEANDLSNTSLKAKNMLMLAIATSIDALAVGISLAFLKVNIVSAVILIGIVTLLLSMAGVKIGNIFGLRYKSKSELFGGTVLVLMGTKILLEHLGILTL